MLTDFCRRVQVPPVCPPVSPSFEPQRREVAPRCPHRA